MTVSTDYGIATGYGLYGTGSNPGKGKIFLFSTLSRPTVGPTHLPIQCVPGDLSQEKKRSGREAGHSASFNVEVKNGGAIPLLPHMC
jgi:hypothetical protein